ERLTREKSDLEVRLESLGKALGNARLEREKDLKEFEELKERLEAADKETAEFVFDA
ncbi:hypothetical protein HDU67_002143, partial [Dinochytrium kinnereticum]